MQVKALKNLIYEGTHHFKDAIFHAKNEHVESLKGKGFVTDEITQNPAAQTPVTPDVKEEVAQPAKEEGTTTPPAATQTPSSASGDETASEKTPDEQEQTNKGEEEAKKEEING